MKLKPLALLVATLPLPASAGDIPTLDSILVTASKPPMRALNASGPGAADLARLRPATSDTAALLRDTPGVALYGAGGVSSLPAIRGLADDRLRIKVDGMDLYAACPNHMNPALSYVDPNHVEALRVYAGISPVSVGGDSIGGTILAETRAPLFAAPGQGRLTRGEVGAFYRGNANARGVNLAATHASETVSLSYSGAAARADNYKAGASFKDYDFTGRAGHTLARDEVGSTAYDTRNHTIGLAFRSGDHLIDARLGYQDMPFQLYPNQRMDLLDNEQKRINLRYQGRFDWGGLEARVYHETVDHFMDFGADKRFWYGPASGGNNPAGGAATPCAPIGPTCAAGMPMYTESQTTGATVKADVLLAPDERLRAGAELHRYRLDDWWPPSGAGMWPGTFWNVKDGERDRAALFAEWEAKPNAQWTTLLGARYERVKMNAGDVTGYNPGGGGNQGPDAAAFNALDRSRADHNVDVAALARYTHDTNLEIELGLARKVRSPGLYEVYPWSTWQMAALMNNFVGDGNGYVGNPDLKPEKAHTISASFDWHAADGSWTVKATPFYTRVSDYIDAVRCGAGGMGQCTGVYVPDPATTSFLRLRYANQSARLYGMELTAKMPLGHAQAGEFGLKGLINYTDGKNRETGDGLYNIMPLNARFTLTHRLRGWDNGIELELVKGKTDVSTVRNEIETPGYGLVHLRASHAWKSVRVDFGIENLFDRLYYLPTGGAYVGQGTTMTNPPLPNYPRWGTAVPGPGRSLYAGVIMKF